MADHRVLAAALIVLVGSSGGFARPGAVATEHPFAAAAGGEVLRGGGSAVDAAVAAAAAVCVVHASSCGIGGGGFALVYDGSGTAHALDFRERAPAGVEPSLYREQDSTRRGGLAVAVPGEVAGWVALHERFGHLPLADVLAPAIRLARGGVRIGDVPHLARQITRQQELLAADPGLAAIFLGKRAGPGQPKLITRPDLATTLERVANEGTAAFYEGAIAEAIATAVQARGGVLTTTDLAEYRPVWRKPLIGRFKKRRIVTFPPPGSGAIVLATLGIVAHDDFAALGRGTPRFTDLLTGAMSRAFRDRARHFGDPDFTTVPLARLLDADRLLRIRRELARGGRPAAPPVRDAGTAHVSVVDGSGHAVALTTTINTAFGAGILVPGTGIILNNEMDDFVVAPGRRNVYGLSGGTANVLAPHKRPQSSMSPTIVLDGARPTLVLGASGGPFIISAVTQVLLDHVAFGTPVATAIAAARVHDQGTPTPLLLETKVSAPIRRHFRDLGYPFHSLPGLGAVSAVGLRRDGLPVAAGDPRKHGGVAFSR